MLNWHSDKMNRRMGSMLGLYVRRMRGKGVTY